MSIFSKLKDYLSSINLRKQTQNHNVSKQIVDDFAKTQEESETERTAPLTEMVDYHKSNPSSPYKLTPETIKHIEQATGLTYEQMQTMDDDKITDCDDSVLLSLGRVRTMEDVDRREVIQKGLESSSKHTLASEETREL